MILKLFSGDRTVSLVDTNPNSQSCLILLINPLNYKLIFTVINSSSNFSLQISQNNLKRTKTIFYMPHNRKGAESDKLTNQISINDKLLMGYSMLKFYSFLNICNHYFPCSFALLKLNFFFLFVYNYFLHTFICFQVFLSNTNNLEAII